MFILLAVSAWLATAAQASIWPYHGSAGSAGATGAAYVEYGPAYGIEPPALRLSQGHSRGAAAYVTSLAANPIVVPDLPARAVIGPSEGSVLVQGPRQGAATIVGPSEGPVVVQGPRQGAATIVGPSEGPVLIQGPQKGAATIVGPSEGPATIIGPSIGGATIVGPSAGAATIVGPSTGGATIIGPSEGPAQIIGPSSAGATIIGPSEGKTTIIGPKAAGVTIIGPSAGAPLVYGQPNAHAHAEAHAEAHAHADAHSHNLLVQQPYQTVYIKELIPGPTIIREKPSIVHYHDTHGHRVVCEPGVGAVSASAAVEAVARAGSRYGPVHVGSVLGRPVVTVSGPPSYPRPIGIYGPPPAPVLLTGPSGSISTASASAGASAGYETKKFWYPGPSWINC